MKITVEISDSDLQEICRVTGERKKGPAIRKLVADALLIQRRAALAQKFISGQWGVQLKSFPEARKMDRKNDAAVARRWRINGAGGAGKGAG